MRTAKEIANYINSIDPTKLQDKTQMPISFAELKNLVQELYNNSDVKLAKKLDNEIESLNKSRTVDQLIEDYKDCMWDSNSIASSILWGEFMTMLSEVMKLRTAQQFLDDLEDNVMPPVFTKHEKPLHAELDGDNFLDDSKCQCTQRKNNINHLMSLPFKTFEGTDYEYNVIKYLQDIAANTAHCKQT